MENIFTYLLGAGASCKSLPLVSNFRQRIGDYKSKYINTFKFKSDTFEGSPNSIPNKNTLRTLLIKDWEWLVKNLRDHYSIDTFARKLYLTRNTEKYNLLKFLTSEFLLVEEIMNGIDPRYDTFFAALLDRLFDKIVLPENIRILSWNYDKQIEFSIAQFLDIKDSKTVEEFVQLFPRKDANEYTQSFGVFKLNGSIGGKISSKGFDPMIFDLGVLKPSFSSKVVDTIMSNSFYRYYLLSKNNNKSRFEDEQFTSNSIDYSWEDNPVVLNTRNKAMTATMDSTYLVVIGYSFPTFNRRIDSQIINNMRNLKKIYIQAPENAIYGVIQRVKAIVNLEVEFESITNVEEFYIPFEYD